jgi:Fe-S-cluster containining protein
MQNPADNIKQKFAKVKQENKKFFQRLIKNTPRDLDAQFYKFHSQAFEKINCLQCANCCKTTGPLFTQKDIERLASHFRIRPAKFINSYLHVDEDNDFVLNELPCPFLGADNYCSIYEYRPNACREYPHTHQRKMHKILKETEANAAICPAVFEIVEQLKKVIP